MARKRVAYETQKDRAFLCRSFSERCEKDLVILFVFGSFNDALIHGRPATGTENNMPQTFGPVFNIGFSLETTKDPGSRRFAKNPFNFVIYRRETLARFLCTKAV